MNTRNQQSDYKLSVLKDKNGGLSPSQLMSLKDTTHADCFIETGTYLGTTTSAMRSVFERVISIELSMELYEAAVENFRSDPGITLLQGDSSERMADALDLAGSVRPIIWLDAHWSGGNTARTNRNTPILSEIKSIRDTGLKDLIVLVDDISYFWSVRNGFKVHDSIGGYPEIETLFSELLSVNPDFCIFINGDVMLAVPAQLMKDINLSPVLNATSKLRSGHYTRDDFGALESIVGNASGTEMNTIMELPDMFSHQLSYGLGGHFCHWRGLVFEQLGRLGDAGRDLRLARECGVDVPLRSWEEK